MKSSKYIHRHTYTGKPTKTAIYIPKKKFNQWKSNEEKKPTKPNENQTNTTFKKKWEQNSCCMFGHKTYTLSNLVRSTATTTKIMNWIFILDNIHLIESKFQIVAYIYIRIYELGLFGLRLLLLLLFFHLFSFHDFGVLFIQNLL